MDSLNLVVTIAEIILFASLTILCIYLVVSLKKITRTIDSLEKNVESLEQKLEPILDNALVVSDNMKQITTDVRTQMAKVDGIVTSVKNTADSIIEFEQKTQREIETQVSDTLNMISAVVTGVRTFISALKGTTNGYKPRKKFESYSEADDY